MVKTDGSRLFPQYTVTKKNLTHRHCFIPLLQFLLHLQSQSFRLVTLYAHRVFYTQV